VKGKVKSLLEKVEVWAECDKGIRTAEVRCQYDLKELMIFFIKKNETRSGEALRPVLH
jgi:hypothetical protein